MIRSLLIAVALAVCLLALSAAAGHHEGAAGESQGETDVVEIVSTNVQG